LLNACEKIYIEVTDDMAQAVKKKLEHKIKHHCGSSTELEELQLPR